MGNSEVVGQILTPLFFPRRHSQTSLSNQCLAQFEIRNHLLLLFGSRELVGQILLGRTGVINDFSKITAEQVPALNDMIAKYPEAKVSYAPSISESEESRE